MADQDNPSPDTISGLVTTLVPLLIYAGVYLAIFLVIRRSQRRYYAPRTYLGSVREEERTPELPNGLFSWVGPFWKIPDTYALQHQSLDSYLFLRFLRICCTIMFVGVCITWPILFPLNATGHMPSNGPTAVTGLNILSFSKLDKGVQSDKYRMIGNALVGWIFYGFVMFMICRESIFYVNLRQAFLLSPVYANRISSRTVLFTSVPEAYRNEAKLHKVFGSSVKNIWLHCDTEKLDELVETRDKLAYRLESAEVKLTKLANGARLKELKKGASHDEEAPIATADTQSGSVAARWLPEKKRPTHKLGKFGLIGKKVDTINYAREQLPKLIADADAAQLAYRNGENKKLGAVFIEFYTQSDAQAAYQTLSHHQALHMSPRYIGVMPFEIVWKSLKISWWQKVIRRYIVVGFITALIVFWAVPVALVGIISNIPYLANTYSWLAWINSIPKFILGVVTGLLPSVMLAVLMSLVPIVMRLCAKLSGEPTLARVELFTQNAYFAFQVIQVFLVVAIGSSATSAGGQIAQNPGSVTTLLATSIPTSANFYISYFIVQGLGLAGGVLAQVVGFVIFRLLYTYLASTPRAMYNKWTNLSAISWGSLLPVYTNMVVIGLVYSCIAPLMMGFAAVGLSFFYIAYRYNILFVTDTKIDTKGLIYPRALQQLTTGVYLGLVVMIGLFGIAVSIPALVLTVIFLIFVALFHISMNNALDPLLYNLPKTLEAEEESLIGEVENGVGSAASPNEKQEALASAAAPHKKPNFFTKWLHPEIYTDYQTLRRLVPHSVVDPNNLYSPETEKDAYYPPSVTTATPLLWIPRDEAGISRQEVAHTSKVIPITDEGSSFNEKNKIVWDAEGARPPIWEEKTYY